MSKTWGTVNRWDAAVILDHCLCLDRSDRRILARAIHILAGWADGVDYAERTVECAARRVIGYLGLMWGVLVYDGRRRVRA